MADSKLEGLKMVIVSFIYIHSTTTKNMHPNKTNENFYMHEAKNEERDMEDDIKLIGFTILTSID